MIQQTFSRLLEKPNHKTGKFLSLGYFFVCIFVSLLILSSKLSGVYLSVMEQDRTDKLRMEAALIAGSLSGKQVYENMHVPDLLPDCKYNVYINSGSSFFNVYSSYLVRNSGEPLLQPEPNGLGDAYRDAFTKQELVITSRLENELNYVSALAPIVNTDGTSAGIVEVLQLREEISYTYNGISLSWFFTIFSISVSLTVVFYQVTKLLDTVLGKPNPMLPKIIRYGTNGYQSIAFFSAVACTLPTIVIGEQIKKLTMEAEGQSHSQLALMILLGTTLFVFGFSCLSSLKAFLSRSLTTRMSILVFSCSAIALLLISILVHNIVFYFLILLPLGFSLGMTFYFQREYRIYASRLGYAEFSERKIHQIQYKGFILGASVGAVFAGIIFERFGWNMIAVLCSILLSVVIFQALFFIQHCPPTNTPRLYLPTFLYAITNQHSGSFLWSGIFPLGVQLSFFMIFLPRILQSLSYSLTTVSFYFIVFFFVGMGMLRFISSLLALAPSVHTRILLSSILQISGYLLLALNPTAKMLVAVVSLFGLAVGLHDFRYYPYYISMIQKDKRPFARKIVEAVFGLGVVLGSLLCNSVFFITASENPTQNIRFGLLIFGFVLVIFLFAYPLVRLLTTGFSNSKKGGAPT